MLKIKSTKFRILSVALLLFMLISALLSIGAYWVQSVGLLPGGAVVFSSNAPATDRMMAAVARSFYGNRVGICDGTADQIEINTAIATLPSYFGGLVYFGSGNFFTSAPIVITRRGGASSGFGRCWLKGEGYAKTNIILQAGSNCDVINTNSVEIYDIEISDMALAGQTTDASGHGLNANGMTQGKFHNLAIGGCKQDGFHVDTNDVGYPGGGFSMTIYDILVSGCLGSGFRIVQGSQDAYMLRTYACEIGYTIASSESRFHMLTADTSLTYGFYITNCTDSQFSQFSAEQNGQQGLVAISTLYCQFTNMNIPGNYTTSAGYANQVTIQNCAYTTFSQINIRDTIANDYGMLFSTANNNLTISDCTILLPSGYAFGGDITSSTFSGSHVNAAYGVYNIVGQNIFSDNHFSGGVPQYGSATNIFINNKGYIAPGEIRTASGSLTAGLQNAIALALHVESQDCYLTKLVINLTTPEGTGAPTLQVGTADDAAGTNLDSSIFTAIDLTTTGLYDSWNAGDTGAMTHFVTWYATGTDDYIVAKIIAADADDIVGTYYAFYCGK